LNCENQLPKVVQGVHILITDFNRFAGNGHLYRWRRDAIRGGGRWRGL